MQAVVNPADRLAIIRVVIVALIAVLALIGLANLLTASALGLRDHAFDLAVLKAMGLTPRQVMATLVTGTGLLVGAGRRRRARRPGASVVTGLIDLQGHTSGVGAGIGRPPSGLSRCRSPCWSPWARPSPWRSSRPAARPVPRCRSRHV